MVVELSVKYPEKTSESIRMVKSVEKLSIIDYDCDDI